MALILEVKYLNIDGIGLFSHSQAVSENPLKQWCPTFFRSWTGLISDNIFMDQSVKYLHLV